MGAIIVQEFTTKNPLQLMGLEAGTCWGANTADAQRNYKRGLDCLTSGHGRVSEFPQVYLELKGYSARTIRELYTHIGGAPTRLQASTRYINYTKEPFTFVIPPSIANNEGAKIKYCALMLHTNEILASLIEDYEIPKEDVAMGLPLGMETDMILRTNARNLIEMSHVRDCSRAYWEFRQLMKDIETALSNYSSEWKEIVELEFKPKCEVYGYCNEKFSCGRKPKKS